MAWRIDTTIATFIFVSVICLSVDSDGFSAEVPEFLRDVEPIFASKCGKCHGEKAREANLDLRSVAAIVRGGDSGPAVSAKGGKGVLLDRIQSGEMPPQGHPPLSNSELDTITRWLSSGMQSDPAAGDRDAWTRRLEAADHAWAFQRPKRPAVPGVSVSKAPLKDLDPIAPDHQSVAKTLQSWYRADRLELRHAQPVMHWPDESGNRRHLKPTWGRMDSQVGTPPRFMLHSTIGDRPAVRFEKTSGLGSPALLPVDINGDGAWTTISVVNVRPPAAGSPTSVIVGFGDPAPGHNPGRPWASLLEIRRDGAFLSHSGGFGHDARMPPESMWALYDRPLVITVVKQPGPMAKTTSIYLNGAQVPSDLLTGVTTSPEIHARKDFGIYMGRANGSLGGLQADVAEVVIYSNALAHLQRQSIESGLIRKYGISDSIAVSAEDVTVSGPSGWPTNPIDAFIGAKLDEAALCSAPVADRTVRIRRAYFDLIGMPPKPEEVDAFVNDATPGAWRRVIERLLDSVHYGERWGRHWLDVARYADTGGYETDIYYRNAWRFRDYVVKSFNDDKPYDRFVQEQIAGDELWPDDLALSGSYIMDPEKRRHFEALTATGFYALGPQIHESNMDAKKLSNERLTDWVDTTASAFLGLTFGCARCHDHKFDPISQRDYYALQAVFAGSREEEVYLQHGMGLADWKQHYPKLIAVDEARQAYRHFEKQTSGRARTPEEQSKLAALKNAIADRLLAVPLADAQKEVYSGIYQRPTVTVLGRLRPELAPEIRLLSRGELSRPKQIISPRLPSVFLRQGRSQLTPDAIGAGGDISRKQLALWLTDRRHPLTARVMVNRIWQWHFGRGIVQTANDFGQMGTPPSHPELLDWLAMEFVARGWSIKAMHRLIMTSRTYQQDSSFYSDDHHQKDADNRLLWRMNRRRLEGEAIWDAVHSVAGTINLAVGGRPVMPPLLAEELTNKSNWVPSQVPSQHTRRGLYIIVRRNFNFPLFDLFDAPVNAVSCSGRDVSTVAPQALWLLNNRLGFNQAEKFAGRLVREAGHQAEDQIQRAWRLALGRQVTQQELTEAVELLRQLALKEPESQREYKPEGDLAKLPADEAAALTKFCLALFNLNEFVFVD